MFVLNFFGYSEYKRDKMLKNDVYLIDELRTSCLH
jgi:hypothetical protein